MTDNLAIWNKLGRTDPAQTKTFKRGGGFAGTAIKPIYTAQKMTEEFGPVGVGWGFSEPKFQLVPGENREVLVYCWLSLWFMRDGVRSADIHGVGGDKVVGYVKASEQYNRPERWENDDEAFKKAFTDAIGNAMKHLGMSADVHMGLFDDSKYVQTRRQEEASERREAAEQAASTPFDKSADTDRTIIETLLMAMRKAESKPALDAWFALQKPQVRELSPDHKAEFLAAIGEFAETLMKEAS